MKNYGRSAIHEFLGDFVVYRQLVPVDPRLPALADFRAAVGVAQGTIPRKSEAPYARAIAHLLQVARGLDVPGTGLARLVYVGDTQLNDGTAFANICRAGGWPGAAFIGTEDDQVPRVEVVERGDGVLYVANRWAALGEFDAFCKAQGVPIDEATAIVIDLDKTALGARGRNDHVIDEARVEAVRRTVGELLGDDWDRDAFQRAYDLLNQPEFHAFTSDNQDYLAYTCLILGSGILRLEPLVAEIRSGRMFSFVQFIAEVEGQSARLPANLRRIHDEVHGRVRHGDPTPFKVFRYNEYRSTVERMGHLDEGMAVVELLSREIVITQEVRAAALSWKARGALLFGLSDKPDEASLPPAELVGQGYEPIHRARTHVVGT